MQAALYLLTLAPCVFICLGAKAGMFYSLVAVLVGFIVELEKSKSVQSIVNDLEKNKGK